MLLPEQAGNSGNSSTVIPSTPGLPLFALTRCNACLQFSSSQTSSLSRSVPARLSVLCFTMGVSVPCTVAVGASLLLSTAKASTPCSGWFFCRRPFMSRTAYLPFPLFPLRGTVRAFDHRSRLGLSCLLRLSALECLPSRGPGLWSGQSGKELVSVGPFLHPETEQQATEVGRSGSGVWLEHRSLAWSQVPCAEQWLTVGPAQLIPFGRVSSMAQLGRCLQLRKRATSGKDTER